MSSETRFTPGPWKLFVHDAEYPNYGHIHGECGIDDNGIMNIRTVAGIYKYGLEAENSANARLIAAAPDLYAALENILARYGIVNDDLCDARAALAKAKGETA